MKEANVCAPSADERAYAFFLIECTDTASVIVSIKPELSDVTKMRKLQMSRQNRGRTCVEKQLTIGSSACTSPRSRSAQTP